MSAAVAVIGQILQHWGKGELSPAHPDSEANLKRLIDEGFVLDGNVSGYEAKNTDGFRTYQGIQGFKEFLAFLGEATPTKFVPELFPAGEDDVIQFVHANFKHNKTGKESGEFSDVLRWTVKDGKALAVNFWWGAPDKLDSIYA